MNEFEEGSYSGAVPGLGARDEVVNATRNAVAIDAPNAFLCILGEHLHLNRRFGRGQWQPYRVSTREVLGRIYDIYDLWFESEREQVVWFDITASINRWGSERLR